MFNILVVEDDLNAQKLIVTILQRAGYTTFSANDGLEAFDKLEKQAIDVIILDLMMPRMDGYQFCQELRRVGETLPILMLSAQQEISQKRKGFLVGTDDYLTKPFDEQEILLRLKALLRRAQIANEQKITLGGTTLDYRKLMVFRGETTESLPKKEFQLLFKLLSSPGVISTRLQLLDELWGPDRESEEHTLDVHIARLRERFKDNPDFELVTVRGLGYKAVKKQ